MSRITAKRNRRANKKHAIAHPLPRQKTQNPIERPRMMARAQILLQLHDLIVACEELFAAHGEACACECCCAVSNMVGSLRIFRMVLEIS